MTRALVVALALLIAGIGQSWAGSLTLLGVGGAPASGGGSTVAVDTTGGTTGTAGHATSFSWTGQTIGSSANAICAVIDFWIGTDPGTVTMKWGTQTMTLVASEGTGNTTYSPTEIFCLRAPATGSQTLSGTWTTTAYYAVDWISFTGVNQTSDSAAFTAATPAEATSGTALSLTVGSAANDYALAGFSGAHGLSSVSATELFINNTQSAGGASYAAGASSVSFSAVQGSSGAWTAAGVSINHQ
jgi:hypothetical protein